MKCVSCNKDFIEGVSFKCVKCGKNEISRCNKCKKLSIAYTCKCGFIGP